MTELPATPPLWDDEFWEPLPRLAGPAHADVCVIGLGGSGLRALQTLAASGVRAVGIDATSVGGGAAGRNGGFLLAGMADFHHRVCEAVGARRAAALHRMTIAELGRMAEETPTAIRRTGSLRLAADEAELDDCQAQLEAMRRDELPVEPYEGPEGRGLLFPDDGSLQPLRRCRLLARELTAEGVRLFERSPVLTLQDTTVRTPGGEITAGAVVVAVDGGLERLLPELAPRVRTARAQMLATAPDLPVRLRRPVYARWGLDYWQQLPDGRVALGGCRDVGGAAEWTTEATPSPVVQGALERLLRDHLGVTASITHRWAGVIAFTDDKLPLLDQVRPGVWAAGAYSGTGNVVGALCGEAAARLSIGGSSEWADLVAARGA